MIFIEITLEVAAETLFVFISMTDSWSISNNHEMVITQSTALNTVKIIDVTLPT